MLRQHRRSNPNNQCPKPVDPWPDAEIPSPFYGFSEDPLGLSKDVPNASRFNKVNYAPEANDYTHAAGLPPDMPPRERHPLTEPAEVDFTDPKVLATLALLRLVGSQEDLDTFRRAYNGRHHKDDSKD